MSSFEQGRIARQSGRLSDALTHFEQALADEPTHLQARIHYAHTLRDLGQLEGAESAYRMVLSDKPDFAPALLGLAHCVRATQGSQAALPHFETALAAGPRDLRVRLDYGDVLRDLKQFASAKAVYSALIVDEPGAYQCHLGLGRCIRESENAIAALPHYEAAVAVAPTEQRARLPYAELLRELKQFTRAEAVYGGLVADQPTMFQAHLGLGRCLQIREGLTAALPHFEAAVAAAPSNQWVRLAYADVLRELKQIEQAEAVFRKLIADEPGLFQAHLGLARCIRERDGISAALPHFEAAVAIAPKDHRTCLPYAEGLQELKQFVQAEAVYRALIAAEPELFQGHLGLARCIREHEGALASLPYFEAAVAVAPRNHRTCLPYAEVLRELKQPAKAEAVFRALVIDEPEVFQAHLGLARCIQQREGSLAALGHFETAVAIAPRNQRARLFYAEALRELKQFEQAEAIFRSLTVDEPDGFEAHLGLARCVREQQGPSVALPYFEAAVAASPRELRVYLPYAQLLRELKLIARAEAVYRKLLVEDPDMFQAHLGVGRCILDREGPLAAVPHFKAAVTVAPTNITPRLAYAEVLRALNRRQEAKAVYEALLAQETDLAQARIGLARCAYQLGDIEQAKDHLRAAAKAAAAIFKPEISALYRNWGLYEDSRRVLRESIDDNALNSADIWIALGHTESHAGQHQASIDAFQRAYALSPHYHELMIFIAAKEKALGRFQRAEELLEQASKENSIASLAYVRLAESASATKNLPRALELALKACRHHPSHPTAPLALAQVRADRGFVDKAIAGLDSTVQSLGHRPEFAIKGGALLRRVGRLQEALTVVSDALRRWPGSNRLRLELFSIEFARGNTEAALACLNQYTAENMSEQAEFHLAHGAVAEALWKQNEAINHYDKAASVWPESYRAQNLLAGAHLVSGNIQAARHHSKEMARLAEPSRLQKGLSSNPSQSLVGQLLDEYLIDDEAFKKLIELDAMPAAKRIDKLLLLVRQKPEYTAAAITLLVTLRKSGYLNTAWAPTTGASPIPAKIAQYWDQTIVPGDLLSLMNTWRDRNPDYQYVRFDDTSAKAFIADRYPHSFVTAYMMAKEPAAKADLFRLAYLYAEGGFYVDADDCCRAPLVDFVPLHANFVGWQEVFGTVGNNFLGTTAGHPVVGLALMLGAAAIHRGDADIVWLNSGPGLLTRAFARILASPQSDWAAVVRNTALLTRPELAKGVTIHCFSSYKMTSKHWAQSAFDSQKKASTTKVVEE